jgi:hypothetical protein
VLVAVNRWLACRDGGAWPRAFGLVSLGAFATVLVVSRAIYVLPTGSTFTALLSEKVDAPKLAGVKDGERVCVQKAPFDMLWAAPFHPPRRYVVKEAEEPGECDGYRRLE